MPWYEWPSFGPIDFHPVEQAPNHPNRKGHQTSYPKWINPWSIKTPAGYSVLFIQPMHRESIFTILPGIVDTDQYNAPVNFPFVLNNIQFEGLIPAGTPIAQVIPFKRESWEMKIGTQEDLENQNKTTIRLRTRFFDSYKSQFRQLKEYK
jgi:predicted membrane-bound spermidine synthase